MFSSLSRLAVSIPLSVRLQRQPTRLSLLLACCGNCKSECGYKASLKTPNLDSRVRGNDTNVSFYALRAMLHSFVIPAKAGIHELLELLYREYVHQLENKFQLHS